MRAFCRQTSLLYLHFYFSMFLHHSSIFFDFDALFVSLINFVEWNSFLMEALYWLFSLSYQLMAKGPSTHLRLWSFRIGCFCVFLFLSFVLILDRLSVSSVDFSFLLILLGSKYICLSKWLKIKIYQFDPTTVSLVSLLKLRFWI